MFIRQIIKQTPILWGIFFLSILTGCSVKEQVTHSVDRTILEIVDTEIKSASLTRHAPLKSGNVIELYLGEAFLMAVRKNVDVNADQISYNQALIDVQQAESQIWPRVSLDFRTEIPLDKDHIDESKWNGGGLFFKYDLMKALLYKDNVYIMSVKQMQMKEKKIATLTRLYFEMLQLCYNLEFHRRMAALLEKEQTTIRRAFDRLPAHKPYDNRQQELSDYWTTKDQELNLKIMENRLRLEFSLDTLRQFIGQFGTEELIITDLDKYLPVIQNERSCFAEYRSFIEEAWNKRSEVSVAEKDLYLAEMAIIAAKYDRLPGLKASLGLGNIPLTNQDVNSDILLEFGISMPLIDMGDIKRKVQKAINHRDLTKLKLTALARRIRTELRSVTLEIDIARQRYLKSRSSLEEAERQEQLIQKLIAVHRAEPMSLYKKQLETTAALSAYEKSLFDYQTKLIKLEETKGDGKVALMSLHIDTNVLSSPPR